MTRYYFQEHTIKEWQDKWTSGEFDNHKYMLHPQLAGFSSWACKTKTAYNKLETIASILTRLENSDKIDLDNMVLHFKNTDPSIAPKYDIIQIFEKDADQATYSIKIDYPFSTNKWVVEGFNSEGNWEELKEFKNVYELAEWFN